MDPLTIYNHRKQAHPVLFSLHQKSTPLHFECRRLQIRHPLLALAHRFFPNRIEYRLPNVRAQEQQVLYWYLLPIKYFPTNLFHSFRYSDMRPF